MSSLRIARSCKVLTARSNSSMHHLLPYGAKSDAMPPGHTGGRIPPPPEAKETPNAIASQRSTVPSIIPHLTLVYIGTDVANIHSLPVNSLESGRQGSATGRSTSRIAEKPATNKQHRPSSFSVASSRADAEICATAASLIQSIFQGICHKGELRCLWIAVVNCTFTALIQLDIELVNAKRTKIVTPESRI